MTIHSLERDLRERRGFGFIDTVVIDDRTWHCTPEEVAAIRAESRNAQLLVLNVECEERCGSLLEVGADDTVMSVSSIVPQRIAAALRRARAGEGVTRAVVGDIVLDRNERRAWCAGAAVHMTPYEFSVLECLVTNAPGCVSVETLAAVLKRDDSDGRANRQFVQTYVCYVRQRLASSRRVRVRFDRDLGYGLVDSASEQSPSRAGVCQSR